ncbi:MAG: hypothetical protein ACHQU0_02630 [Candidatus Paceibacteria bacterium]
MKKFTDLFSSRHVRLAVGILGSLFLAALIFHAGVVVGSHQGFAREGQFGRGFRPPFFPGGFEMPHGFIQDGHGAVGAVTAITLPTLVLQTREGTSQTIVVGTSTVLRSMDGPGVPTLSVGDTIIVLGEPDDQNRVHAAFIRILHSVPPLP